MKNRILGPLDPNILLCSYIVVGYMGQVAHLSSPSMTHVSLTYVFLSKAETFKLSIQLS